MVWSFDLQIRIPMDGVLAGHADPIIQNGEVELHFANVLGLELAHFQFDRDQGGKAAMKKKEVDKEFLVVDFNPILAPDEAEHATHFQQEWLNLC